MEYDENVCAMMGSGPLPPEATSKPPQRWWPTLAEEADAILAGETPRHPDRPREVLGLYKAQYEDACVTMAAAQREAECQQALLIAAQEHEAAALREKERLANELFAAQTRIRELEAAADETARLARQMSTPTCANADCEWCAHDVCDARNGVPRPPTCPTLRDEDTRTEREVQRRVDTLLLGDRPAIFECDGARLRAILRSWVAPDKVAAEQRSLAPHPLPEPSSRAEAARNEYIRQTGLMFSYPVAIWEKVIGAVDAYVDKNSLNRRAADALRVLAENIDKGVVSDGVYHAFVLASEAVHVALTERRND